MRIKIVILILMLTPMIMKSQNATATLGNILSCPGQNVQVPMDVTGFFEVGAMTFYIGYDTNAVEFLSLENINPVIPSWISVNVNNGQIALAYSSPTPFDLDGEKLLDLSFSYLSDSTELTFLTGTEIANINLEIIPLDTFTGSINNSIQIINQPDSVQAYPDNDVSFKITVFGTSDFQWQENSGSGWIDLQNNSTYFGVNNDTLYIYDVSLDFNGNIYRCEVTSEGCSLLSDVALLEVAEAYPVASLGYLSSCPDDYVFEPLSVGDFFDVTEFTFNITFNTGSMSFVDLAEIHPDLLNGTLTTVPISNPPGVSIYWIDTEPVSITSGNLFDLIFDYSSGSQVVDFGSGSYVLNSLSNPIDITFNGGGIEQYETPIIINHPQNDTVIEMEEAIFSVETSGANNYNWQISLDNGNSWNDLSNDPPYSEVNTATLSIAPAVYELNGNYYRCRLSNTECQIFSGAAILTVDTLTFINEYSNDLLVKIFPVPFNDIVTISLNELVTANQLKVFNEQGQLIGCSSMASRKGDQIINLDLSAQNNGLFFLQIIGEINGKAMLTTQKVLKIK